MAVYQRFISYIYRYEKGRKKDNSGFAKIESRNNVFRVSISVRGVSSMDSDVCRVYALVRRNERLYGILLGAASPVGTSLECKMTTSALNVGGKECTFDEVCGVLVDAGYTLRFATCWDDRSFDVSVFIPDELPRLGEKPKREVRAAEITELHEYKREKSGYKEEAKRSQDDENELVSIPHDEEEVNQDFSQEELSQTSEEARDDLNNQESIETDSQEAAGAVSITKGEQELPSQQTEDAESLPDIENIQETRIQEIEEQEIHDMLRQRYSQSEQPENEQSLSEQFWSGHPQSEQFQNEQSQDMQRQSEQFQKEQSQDMHPQSEQFQNEQPQDIQSQSEQLQNEQSQSGQPQIRRPMNRWLGNQPPQREQLQNQQTQSGQSQNDQYQNKLHQTERSKSQVENEDFNQASKDEVEKGMADELGEDPHADMSQTYTESMNMNPEEQNETSSEVKTAEAMPEQEANFRNMDPESRWEGLKSRYKMIEPFQDNEIMECIQLEPKDLVNLRKEEWVLGNNSFLLHGYYNYRYLIMGKMEKGGRIIFILGVPGVFENQEKVMANMFGFPNFKPARPVNSRQGEFGYWYRIVR